MKSSIMLLLPSMLLASPLVKETKVRLRSERTDLIAREELAALKHDHSKHNCCQKTRETLFKWIEHDNLTKAVCTKWYTGDKGAYMEGGTCREDAHITRIDGKDFTEHCQILGTQDFGLREDQITGGYRGVC